MKSETFEFEIITPCFCGGAEPQERAEIRAPSIRGQLRWWFRALWGFKSLAKLDLKEQEAAIFGSASGESGCASKLTLRVEPCSPGKPLFSKEAKDDIEMNAKPGSDKGYLLFPLRKNRKGVFLYPYFFKLTVLWKGDDKYWDDICALIKVFGHLGALGFRSRRAMGALSLRKYNTKSELKAALNRFNCPSNIDIKYLKANSSENAIIELGRWLKRWRSSAKSMQNQGESGYKYAKNDRDIGYNILNGIFLKQPTYKPAIGLPIIQSFKGRGKVNWCKSRKEGREEDREEGRFASPVILRPYKSENNQWYGLVMFVDIYKWRDNDNVYIDGKPFPVSLDLYKAMKNSSKLEKFL